MPLASSTTRRRHWSQVLPREMQAPLIRRALRDKSCGAQLVMFRAQPTTYSSGSIVSQSAEANLPVN